MSGTYHVQCLSTALSPITQMAGTSGNEAVIQRDPGMTPQGIRYLPALSGNALRHKMVRAPGARFLVERLGLRSSLSMRQLNFLFHGGALTESTSRTDTAGIAEFQSLFPFLRLVGGSLPNAILPGSLNCFRGVLICRENAARVECLSRRHLPRNLRPAESFVDGYQYTRGDVKNSARDLASTVAPDETNLMIYSGQSVIAGAMFFHGFTAQHVSDLEMGALLLSISIWQLSGAIIGGQSSRGHGKLQTLIHCEPELDATAVMRAYVGHVDAHREKCIAWLADTFAEKAEKPKRGRKEKVDATAQDNGDPE